MDKNEINSYEDTLYQASYPQQYINSRILVNIHIQSMWRPCYQIYSKALSQGFLTRRERTSSQVQAINIGSDFGDFPRLL